MAAIDSISQVPERPTVVATFSILADWVRQIAGHDVHVTCLVGPGGNAHTFEPTSLDAVMLSNADLISEMGAGFEVWLTSLVAGSGSLAVLRLSATDCRCVSCRRRDSPYDSARSGCGMALRLGAVLWCGAGSLVRCAGDRRDQSGQGGA